jgi:putative DNA primase/helicase
MVNSLIPEQSLVLFSGSYGTYKSWIALDLSYAIITGGLFANLSTSGPRPVLYLDKENGRDMIARRLETMGLLGAAALDDIKYWGTWVPLKFPDIDHQQMLDWAKEEQGLVIFDSLKRFHRADENSSTEMSVVMERFLALRDAGATVLLLHHAGKDEKNKFRGSEEIGAAVDIAYKVSRDPKDKRTVNLEQYKNRITEEVSFRITLDQGGRFVWEDPE